MNTSATNRRIRALITAIKEEKLIPRPEFQRRLVWSNKHKRSFIETVLLGYPFPEIYIAAGDVDPTTGQGTELLVDGQQRITTLLQYFTGSPDLQLGDVKRYAEVPLEEQLAFLEYEVVVRDLGRKSISEIKQIFTRINSTQYSLNAMELHNARFDGELKQFGEAIAEHPFFEAHRVFLTQDVRRMGDVRFALIVIVTILSSYFNRDDQLEEFLERYNDEFEAKDEIRSQLERAFQTIDSLELPQKSRAWKKADLLTLIVEVHRLVNVDGVRPRIRDLSRRLKDFYSLVDSAGKSQAKSITDVEAYYRAALQATNDRSSRITRGQVLAKVLRGARMD
jgi:hypothetical protein